MPFYFLANLPAKRDEGVLILQRRSQYGIRDVLFRDFARHLKFVDSKVQAEINPLVPQQLIDQYLQGGRLTKVRFIRFAIPSDVTDAFDAGGHVEEDGRVELVISARRNRSIPLLGPIRDVVTHKRRVNEMIELRDFDYDNVKVELEIGGSRRTLDLSNITKLRANYDITRELKVGTNGHPVFASIDAIAKDLMGTLVDALEPDGVNIG